MFWAVPVSYCIAWSLEWLCRLCSFLDRVLIGCGNKNQGEPWEWTNKLSREKTQWWTKSSLRSPSDVMLVALRHLCTHTFELLRIKVWRIKRTWCFVFHYSLSLKSVVIHFFHPPIMHPMMPVDIISNDDWNKYGPPGWTFVGQQDAGLSDCLSN